jgi:NAD-dependent dihydropyrimidine dehydrogenase PreA subunit
LLLFLLYDQVMAYVPGPVGMVKSVVIGLLGIVGVVAYGLMLGGWSAVTLAGWSLAFLLVAIALGFDLDGTSPLRPGGTVAYYARRWPGIMKLWALIGYDLEMPFRLSLDADLCRGCKTCLEVCPKAVFGLYSLNGSQKSRLVRPEACVQCTACVKQCPEMAIVSEPPVKMFQTLEV